MPPRPLALRLIPERLARRSKTSKRSPAARNDGNREGNSLKKIVGAVAVLLSPGLDCSEKAGSTTPAQAVHAERAYRMDKGKRIPFTGNGAGARAAYNDDWRIYARSASDDKSPIVALLAAIDALRAKKIPLAVNLKLVLEGEEEAGSPNLQRTLELHKNLLGGDLLITGDGPVHQSGRVLVFFGNRGILGFSITTYGPIRALHSGHYGNWAPNPAFHLARLLASMKSENGRVLISKFYDDVAPLGEVEKKVLEAMPKNDAELQTELQFGKAEGNGALLNELLQLPSLNVRGVRSAYVGEQAQNIVPD